MGVHWKIQFLGDVWGRDCLKRGSWRVCRFERWIGKKEGQVFLMGGGLIPKCPLWILYWAVVFFWFNTLMILLIKPVVNLDSWNMKVFSDIYVTHNIDNTAMGFVFFSNRLQSRLIIIFLSKFAIKSASIYHFFSEYTDVWGLNNFNNSVFSVTVSTFASDSRIFINNKILICQEWLYCIPNALSLTKYF